MPEPKRAWSRIPNRPQLARTPVDRALALGWEGDPERAAADTGYAAQTWRVWRNRQNGELTEAQRESVETALAHRGWLVPADYLIGEGVRPVPDRTSPDAALSALEARRLAAQEAGHAPS